MHSRNSHVRIFDYMLLPPDCQDKIDSDADYRIISAVSFSPDAESHKGLCHGGTMCAVMDDCIGSTKYSFHNNDIIKVFSGWMGFCESGKCIPWSGYTVQVDTSLKKAISINSTLKLEAWIEKREGKKKIYVKCKLWNPMTQEVHALGSGLFLKTIKE